MSSSAIEETTTHTVVGMTCTHCASAVTDEVSNVAGVTNVDVDLESGRVSVTGRNVSPAEVAAAVEEAGYEVRP